MKVLVIITTKLVEFGGIANAFMNYYRKLDFSDLEIDVVSCDDYDKTLAREIHENGGNCYAVPVKQKNILRYLVAVNQIMKNGYDVVDVHGNSSTMLLEMCLAKKNKIDNRMAHCLNSKTDHPFVHMLLRSYFNRLCITKTACTKEAGAFLYGQKKYIVLKNAIETEKYRFSFDSRRQIRKQYDIKENEIVFGTVGKINQQKNQSFLVRVFSMLKIQNARLLLVGDGPLRNDIEQLIRKYKIEKKVILAGMISNVVPYYSAFDVYLFPSIFEGLSLALMEAKCSGLVGIASENIKTEDDDTTHFIRYRALNEKVWVNEIRCICEKNEFLDREKKSKIAIEIIKQNGYDIVQNVGLLRELYFQI